MYIYITNITFYFLNQFRPRFSRFQFYSVFPTETAIRNVYTKYKLSKCNENG